MNALIAGPGGKGGSTVCAHRTLRRPVVGRGAVPVAQNITPTLQLGYFNAARGFPVAQECGQFQAAVAELGVR